MRKTLTTAALLAAVATAAPPDPVKPVLQWRWVYCSQNLQVNARADELVRIIERAGRAGYNGVVFADYKLNILDSVTDNYFANAARVRKAAEANHLEIIPCVF